MGGYGSGQRWDSKDTIEDYKRIDVLWMKRRGYLEEGSSGSLTWSRNGDVYSTISFRTSYDALRLIYKSRSHGGEWQDVDYSTTISWDECRFGGSRPYFICKGLGCGKRVQHLYAGNPYFVCRHCMKLAYASQREELLDRAARRADKLRVKLGAEAGILNGAPYRKPKGMHWKTFQKLRIQETHFRNTSLMAMCDKLGFDPHDGFG